MSEARDSEDASREIEIDGETWHAQKWGERYLLYRDGAHPDDPTSLPAENGLCDYCLSDDTETVGERNGYLKCGECGERWPIVSGRATTVGVVRDGKSGQDASPNGWR